MVSLASNLFLSISGESLEKGEKIPIPQINITHKKNKPNKVVVNSRLTLNNMYSKGGWKDSLTPSSGTHVDNNQIYFMSSDTQHSDISRMKDINKSPPKRPRELLEMNQTSINFRGLKSPTRHHMGYNSMNNTPLRTHRKLGSHKHTRSTELIPPKVQKIPTPQPKRNDSNYLFSALGHNINDLQASLGKGVVAGPYQSGFTTFQATSTLPHRNHFPLVSSRQFLVPTEAPSAARRPQPVIPQTKEEEGTKDLYISQTASPKHRQNMGNMSKANSGLSNKIQFALVQKISEIDKLEINNPFDRPLSLRITKAIEALTLIAKQKSVFQDYLYKIIQEIERAVFVKEGEIPEILHNKKMTAKHLKHVEDLNFEEIPFFTAMYHIVEAFDKFVYKSKRCENELKATIKGLEANLTDKISEIKKIELGMNDLKKTNKSPIYQQYMTLTDENAELNKELNIKKYKISNSKEEYSRLKYELKECQSSNDLLRIQSKQLLGVREESEKRIKGLEKELYQLKKAESRMKEKYQNMGFNLQSSSKKMEQLEGALSRSQDENATLSIRAATKFGELTPRYKSWIEVFEELGVEKPGTRRNSSGKARSSSSNLKSKSTSEEYITYLLKHTRQQKLQLHGLKEELKLQLSSAITTTSNNNRLSPSQNTLSPGSNFPFHRKSTQHIPTNVRVLCRKSTLFQDDLFRRKTTNVESPRRLIRKSSLNEIPDEEQKNDHDNNSIDSEISSLNQ